MRRLAAGSKIGHGHLKQNKPAFLHYEDDKSHYASPENDLTDRYEKNTKYASGYSLGDEMREYHLKSTGCLDDADEKKVPDHHKHQGDLKPPRVGHAVECFNCHDSEPDCRILLEAMRWLLAIPSHQPVDRNAPVGKPDGL